MGSPRGTIWTASPACSRVREHKLAGRSYVGCILVLDAAKGGVATAWMLHEMQARGIVPAALVLNTVNPIMVQGAALADFTMMSGFEIDITQAVPDGALVEVDPTSDPPCLRILSSTLSNYAAYASAFAARCHNWRGIFKLSRLARDTKET